MNIIMWWTASQAEQEALPHNYGHVHSFFVPILQGQHKQHYWEHFEGIQNFSLIQLGRRP